MLTEIQKIQIRRHLGYPVVGNPISSPISTATLGSPFQGYRFFQVYGQLEYRMNWMSIFEEAIVTGLSVAPVSIVSPIPGAIVGAGLTATINIIVDVINETVVYVTNATDDIYTIGTQLASLIMANANLVGATVIATSPLTTGAFSQAAKPPATVQPYPGIQITCTQDFNIVTSGTSPLSLVAAPGSGLASSPVTALEDSQGDIEDYRGYLPILNFLQARIATASDNLDTAKADVWTARADEPQARTALYNYWRSQLAGFLGLPLWEDTGYGFGGKDRAASRSGGMSA